MDKDSRKMRGERPFVFTSLKTQEGVDSVVSWIRRELLFADVDLSPTISRT